MLATGNDTLIENNKLIAIEYLHRLSDITGALYELVNPQNSSLISSENKLNTYIERHYQVIESHIADLRRHTIYRI